MFGANTENELDDKGIYSKCRGKITGMKLPSGEFKLIPEKMVPTQVMFEKLKDVVEKDKAGDKSGATDTESLDLLETFKQFEKITNVEKGKNEG